MQVSRASFYRSWEQRAPGEAETALRDVVQRIALANRHLGYRRITPAVHQAGFVIGASKVRQILKSDNLLAVRRRKFVEYQRSLKREQDVGATCILLSTNTNVDAADWGNRGA